MDGKDIPLLDPAVLERLRDGLEGEKVYRALVQNFILLLPDWAENVRVALTTGDVVGALDAVLSLKSSSQMVGAERLAELSADLERSLRMDAYRAEPARLLPQLAAITLTRITRCSEQTTYLLLKFVA
jgi:HPt (histidine-containing phosphotransfer) domain-containing protein